MKTTPHQLIAAVALAAAAAGTSAGTLTYQYDDGASNFGLGPTIGDGFVALNAFNVSNGFDTITSLDVWVVSPEPMDTLTAGVWADPNQDGDPSDAILLGTSALTPSPSDDGFLNLVLSSPIDVGGAVDSFFAGVFFDNITQLVTIGVDTDYAGPPVSWTVEYADVVPNPNDLSGAESRSSALMIRANAVPAPGAAAMVTVAGLALSRRRR